MPRFVFILLLLIALPFEAMGQDFIVPETVRFAVSDDPAFADPTFDDSSWDLIEADDLDPQGKLLWFRVHLDGDMLVKMNDANPIGVFVMALASREVYFNGVFLGASGVPGATPQAETPGAVDAVYFLPPKLIKPGDNLLAVRMSSHHLQVNVSHPLHAVYVAEYKEPNLPRRAAYLPAIFAGGAIVLGAFYFLGLFFANRRDYASLALSILAFAVVGQLIAEAWRAFDLYPYTLHMIRLWIILGCALIAGAALAGYSALVFAPHRRRIIFLLGGGLAAISLFSPGYDFKTVGSILAFVIAAFIATLFGIANKGNGARIAAAAIAIFFGVFFLAPRSFLDQSYYILMALLILALFFIQVRLLAKERRAREEASIKAVRLRHELLKKQIQPHFLMNTLTALAEWIENDPKKGIEMIDAIAEELRLLFDISEKTLIPLSQEIELCERHLAVMSLRNRVAFKLEVNQTPDEIEIPPATVLTLIENAFTHNEYRGDETFKLSVTRSNGEFHLRCETPLRNPREKSSRSGAGLAYIRARLKEAYGEHWRLSSKNVGPAWETEISWPA